MSVSEAAGTPIGVLAFSSSRAAIYAYVSNAESEDISVFGLNPATGALGVVQTAPVGGTAMPMALSPDRLRL
ncbi:hypothetical protein PTKU46_83750 [Paraburkholderia terrae]